MKYAEVSYFVQADNTLQDIWKKLPVETPVVWFQMLENTLLYI